MAVWPPGVIAPSSICVGVLPRFVPPGWWSRGRQTARDARHIARLRFAHPPAATQPHLGDAQVAARDLEQLPFAEPVVAGEFAVVTLGDVSPVHRDAHPYMAGVERPDRRPLGGGGGGDAHAFALQRGDGERAAGPRHLFTHYEEVVGLGLQALAVRGIAVGEPQLQLHRRGLVEPQRPRQTALAAAGDPLQRQPAAPPLLRPQQRVERFGAARLAR